MMRVDLEELERLERGATPGPWTVLRDGWGVDCGVNAGDHGHPGPFEEVGDVECTTCRLIVAMRNNLGPMLAELRRLRELEAAVLEHGDAEDSFGKAFVFDRRPDIVEAATDRRNRAVMRLRAAIAACRAAKETP